MRLPYRLRLPGPTTVPERVRLALASPMVNHRGDEFAELYRDIEARLQRMMGTDGPVLVFAASGSGMMEASLANTTVPDDNVLVICNGQFADRFASIAESLALHVDRLAVPWGEAVEPEVLREQLRTRSYKAVVSIHNESSTGAVADLASVGDIVSETSALLIVDSVSGLGGIEMRQDDWGVDVLVSASQKALMCPPGLGLASVSAKAWEVIERRDARSLFYWDFITARANATNGQTPFTPAVSLTYGLREALLMIDEEGLEQVLARHARLSSALQAGGAALDLPVFTRAPMRSNTVTVFQLPEGKEAGPIVSHLREHYGTIIAGARNRLKGTVIRFGTMGAINDNDIITDLVHLEATLLDLGWPVSRGAGVVAAGEALASV